MAKFIEINTIRDGKLILNTDIISNIAAQNFSTDTGVRCNARIITRSSGPVISSNFLVTETYDQLKEMLEVK